MSEVLDMLRAARERLLRDGWARGTGREAPSAGASTHRAVRGGRFTGKLKRVTSSSTIPWALPALRDPVVEGHAAHDISADQLDAARSQARRAHNELMQVRRQLGAELADARFKIETLTRDLKQVTDSEAKIHRCFEMNEHVHLALVVEFAELAKRAAEWQAMAEGTAVWFVVRWLRHMAQLGEQAIDHTVQRGRLLEMH